MNFCECGCGLEVKDGKRFVYCHHSKGRILSKETRERMSIAQKGRIISKEHRDKISKTLIGQNKGKTYEERYGIEKAKEMKDIRSNKFIGKSNPQFGKPAWNSGHTKDIDKRLEIVSCKVRKFRQGKTWEEVMNNAEAAKEKRRVYLLSGGAAHALSFIKNPSKPQKKIYEMVCSVYPSAVLNHPVFNYSIDVAIPDRKIAVEYDGSYWHKDEEKDLRRQKKIEGEGWKFLRYRDFLPNENELLKDLEAVIHKGYNPIFIDQNN